MLRSLKKSNSKLMKDDNNLSPHREPSVVTVVIPTFGRAQYLRLAIDSALKQSFTNFNLLIGDNSATDDAEAVVQSFKDPRIRYIRHSRNLGAQGNWLALIEQTSTPLIATLHDDDAWHPDFLAKLVPPLLADADLAMSFGDFELIDEQDRPLAARSAELSRQTHRDSIPAGRMQPNREQGLRLVAVWQAPNPAICAVIRREQIMRTSFPEPCAPLYDLWLNYQLIKRRAAFYFVADKLTRYRIHSSSSSAAGFAVPEDHIYQTILSENPDAGAVNDEIRQYWATIRWGRAVRHMADHSRRDSSKEEFRAAAPYLRKPQKRLIANLAGHSNLAWSALRWVRQLKGGT